MKWKGMKWKSRIRGKVGAAIRAKHFKMEQEDCAESHCLCKSLSLHKFPHFRMPPRILLKLTDRSANLSVLHCFTEFHVDSELESDLAVDTILNSALAPENNFGGLIWTS